jgi:competence protein ComEA
MIDVKKRWRARPVVWVVGALSAVALGSAFPYTAGAASRTPQSGKGNASTPPEVFSRVCGHCHDSGRIVEDRRLRSQWDEVVNAMVDRGATGTDADFDAVIEYLVSEYGRVNVNADAPSELAQVLHLKPEDADAIVAYRQANGKFADFNALTAVPGIPVDALKQRRDAIVF